MEYPVWHLTQYGGGFIIALIATVHVFVSHFAVGGGLFLVLAEKKAYRENSRRILAYVKSHTRFFLLLTMVFGGLTGVAIWFIISVLAPGPTSTLIHTFVFGWATEWVCFVGEILALLLYYYSFDWMERRKHLILGWLYFIFAWLSLVLISGIIDFMLTPGGWLATGDFWQGFFNPTFIPSVILRTGLALTITGLFGFTTATFIEEDDARISMQRYAAWWVLLPIALTAVGGYLYLGALPAAQAEMILSVSREIKPYLTTFKALIPLSLIVAALMAAKLPRAIARLVAIALLAFGFAFIGSFEYVREAARRPYLVHGHTYSSGIKVSESDALLKDGYLAHAKWVPSKTVSMSNRFPVGEALFQRQCSPCHSIGGPMKDIMPRTTKFGLEGMDSFLSGMGTLTPYMPPFLGNVDERLALASYITGKLHGKSLEKPQPPKIPQDAPVPLAFDPAKDRYVLLSWNNLGMHCISDAYSYFNLLPPANDIYAQLVERGDPPKLVTAGITLTYAADKDFADPASKSLFWKYSDKLFGKKLPDNVGLSGNGLKGEMAYNGGEGWFEATLIPLEPYPASGGYNPYPVLSVEARDKATGALIASTLVVAPNATEMGCGNCHGGGWKIPGMAGIPDEAGGDILAVHDKLSGTNLLEAAKAGEPKLCQSCHPDPVLGAKGNPGLLSLPAALHGFHANYLSGKGDDACVFCHPNRTDGPTRCMRGRHAASGFGCTRCHGFLEDHALSLLKREDANGKKGAKRLMENLKARTVSTKEEINARTPWLQEPDCMNCHKDYVTPDPDEANAFNVWTGDAKDLYRMRRDDFGALACAACHNSPHAVYPARNTYGKDRDNLQPLQYQNLAETIGARGNCNVCHTKTPKGEPHHKGLKP